MRVDVDHPAHDLLAVDLGLSTGMAVFGPDGRLRSYRSQHFANAASLRRAAYRLLGEYAGVRRVYLEGGGNLADIWEREGEKRGLAVHRVAAETWRAALLYPRQQRSGRHAKRSADELARRVIDWSGAPRPTSLRHDAAEAILIGLWAVLEAGWLEALPDELRPA
jgi:hypothetical protein